jgi:hypothetical protein
MKPMENNSRMMNNPSGMGPRSRSPRNNTTRSFYPNQNVFANIPLTQRSRILLYKEVISNKIVV